MRFSVSSRVSQVYYYPLAVEAICPLIPGSSARIHMEPASGDSFEEEKWTDCLL
jgi:hypothetical protein